MEQWRDVVGFEGIYKVSDHGRILSIKTGKFKIPTTNKENRPHVGLWKNNKMKMTTPHKIVMEAFVSKRPLGMECCHNDGNPHNNHISNLRWDTASSNQRDRVAHGTSNRGERCASAKLTQLQVIQIRQDSRLQREIALDYGVRGNTISRIKNYKRWAHLNPVI